MRVIAAAMRDVRTRGGGGPRGRSLVDLPRHWLALRAVPGSYLPALPGFFHAGGEAPGVERDVATLSRFAPYASQRNAGRFARCPARLPGAHDHADADSNRGEQPVFLGHRDGVSHSHG